MKYEILYIKDKAKGYPKIIAIKESGFAWGEGEKRAPFGIALIEMTAAQKADIENYNEYCLDDFDNPKKLADTPDNCRPWIVEEKREIVSMIDTIEKGEPKQIITKTEQIIKHVINGEGTIPFAIEKPAEIMSVKRKEKGKI